MNLLEQNTEELDLSLDLARQKRQALDAQNVSEEIALKIQTELPESGNTSFSLSEQLAQQKAQMRDENIRASVMYSMDKDPNMEAKVQKYAEENGIAPDVVKQNFSTFLFEEEKARINRAAANSPTLAEYYSNPDFVAVAKDDVGVLETIAQTFNATTEGLGHGVELQRQLELSYKEVLGTITPIESAQLEDYRKRSKEFAGKYKEGLPSWFKEASSVLGMNIESFSDAAQNEGLLGLGAGSAIGGTLGAIGGPGAPVTVPAGASIYGTQGFITGTSAGYLVNTYEMSVGEAYEDLREFRTPEGATIDPLAARYASLIVGVPNTALETFALGKALKLVPGYEKMAGYITKDQMKRVLTRPTMREALKDISLKYGDMVATETFTEGFQKFLVILARETAQEFSEGEFGEYSAQQLEQDISDVAEESTAAFKASVVLGGIGGGVKAYQAQRDVNKANQNRDVFLSLAENAKSSKLRERLPKKFEEFIKSATQNGPVQNVYVDADRFNELFQSRGVDPAQAAKEMGAKNYEEAYAAGTDVVIPIEKFATNVAPSDYFNDIVDDIRLNQGDKSFREAQAYLAEQEARDEEIRLQAEELSGQIQTPELQSVKKEFMDHLVAGGEKPQIADTKATLYAAQIKTLSEKTGLSPLEIHSQFELTVSRPLPDALTQKRQTDIQLDPLIDRLRAGDRPTQREVYGESLIDFLVGKGGLLPAGELMDVEKERRGLIKPTGMTADDAASIAVQAGYLPGRTTEAVTPDDLFEAILDEISGGLQFAEAQVNEPLRNIEAQLNMLEEYLASINVDLAEIADNAEVRRLMEQAAANPEIQDAANRLYQSVFHGSPYTFDRFSLEAVGTGEGAQAFGWGLYFAEQRSIAEFYQDKLSAVPAEYRLNGQNVDQLYRQADVQRQYDVLEVYESILLHDSPAELQAKYTEEAGYSPEVVQFVAGITPETLKAYDQNGNEVDAYGALYQVDIPENNELLVWDEPVFRQSESVIQKLRAAEQQISEATKGVTLPGIDINEFLDPKNVSDNTVSRLYGDLAVALGSDKAASDLLSSIGIPGHRYLDSESRYKTYRELRDEFLQELPEDATFEEVMEMANEGKFSDANTAILRALDKDDWLGFDYPAQAISAALTESVSQYDPSLELTNAIYTARKNPTYNYVIWDENVITIEAVNDQLREAEQLAGEQQTLFQFAGVESATRDIGAYMRAQDMEREGRPAEMIRRETGWFKGIDGVWRYEISDDEATLGMRTPDGAIVEEFKGPKSFWKWEDVYAQFQQTPKFWEPGAQRKGEVKVKDILDHPLLFAAYPEIAEFQVAVTEEQGGIGGYYDRKRTIYLGSKNSVTRLKSILLHEIQHGIQEIEGFALGGSADIRFTESVQNALRELKNRAETAAIEERINQHFNIKRAEDAAETARYGLIYESAERLLEYSRRDKPSGVFRLIRNEMQWLYGEDFRQNERAQELQRSFYEIPKKGDKRNEFLRNMAFEASEVLRESIPEWRVDLFKKDPRQLRNMVAALQREAGRSRQELQALERLKAEASKAGRIEEITGLKSPFEVYQALAGEIEARATQARMNLTAEQRRERSPRRDLDVSQEEAIVIMGGMELQLPERMLSQGRLPDRRGAIEFGPRVPGKKRTFNIKLFENADLSTFVHELGHFYLEVVGDLAEMAESSQQLKDDYAKILNFLGAESRADITLDGKKKGSAEYNRAVEMHEKFARANEAYLMEGKAPSVELRPVFQRIRSWMLHAYKILLKLPRALRPEGLEKAIKERYIGFGLTDEVRAVFDRIYATEEEILTAKSEMQLDPLFVDATAAGMTEVEFEAYRASVVQATESGKEALQQKLMDQLMRERKAWWKRELEAVEKEVAAEVDALPIYQAFKELTEGETKLDRDELIQRYGKEYLKRLPRAFGTIYRVEGGLPMDAAARLLGYNNGEQLIEALVNMRPRKEYIKAEADRIMRERHGDMLTDGTITDEAIAALHNEQREKVLASELRALRRKQREVRPFVQAEREKAQQQRRAARQATKIPPMAAFRRAAKETVARTKVRDLEPQKYLNAQRKQARKAFDAMSKGDYIEAAEAKQREILNHFLYLEAKKARDNADKIAKNMAQFEKKATRQRIGKAGKTYLEQIDAILEGYEFRRVSLRAMDRRGKLNEFVRKQEAEGEPVNIPQSVLDDSRQINYRDLTVSELDAINESVQNIAHLARLKNKLLMMAEKRELDDAASEAIEQIRLNSKKGKQRKLETALPSERLGRWAKGFMLIHTKFSTLFRQMDGWKDGGTMWELFVRPLNERADWETSRKSEETKKLSELFRVYRGTDMYAKKFIPGLNRSMSLQGRLMVALNWGRAENRQRLIGSGDFSQTDIDAILDSLDERDWNFVQSIWKHMESFWPEISAQYEKLYGVPPTKSDPLPFETKFGTMPGGYFPIKYDPQKSAQAQFQTIEETTDLMRSGAYVRSMTKNGFTKETLENLNRAVKLDFSTIYEHTAEVIHDLALREYLIDFNKIMGHRVNGTTVKDTINDYYGDQVLREIFDTIRDVTAGDIVPQNAFETGLGHLRAGTSIAFMGWNAITAAIQVLGLTQSIVRIGPKWVAKGVKRWGSNAIQLQSSTKIIYEKSSFMRTRYLTQNREINEIRNKLKRQGRFPIFKEGYGAIEDSFFYFIAQMQKTVDVPTWFGAYEKALAQGADEKKAIALADQAVIDSQASGMIKDLAKIERGTGLMKIWTVFYSYFNTTLQRSQEAFGKTNYKNPFDIGRLAVDLILLWHIPAVLGYAMREAICVISGGCEDKTAEELMMGAMREQAGYLMGMFVGVRELSSMLDPRFDYSGPAGVRFFAEMTKLATQVSQGEMDDALRKRIVTSAGIWLHFPATQLNRVLDGISAMDEGRTQSPAAVLFGLPRY